MTIKRLSNNQQWVSCIHLHLPACPAFSIHCIDKLGQHHHLNKDFLQPELCFNWSECFRQINCWIISGFSIIIRTESNCPQCPVPQSPTVLWVITLCSILQSLLYPAWVSLEFYDNLSGSAQLLLTSTSSAVVTLDTQVLLHISWDLFINHFISTVNYNALYLLSHICLSPLTIILCQFSILLWHGILNCQTVKVTSLFPTVCSLQATGQFLNLLLEMKLRYLRSSQLTS